MSGELKADLQIPDLWYDFYARLLPGAVFVVAIRCYVFNNTTLPGAGEMFVLAAAGYLSGLLTQPLASRLTGAIERFAAWHRSKERHYIGTVQQRLGESSRKSMILSKMHGEVAFFAQLGILSVVFGLLERAQYIPFILAPFALAAAFEVALRRLQRAMDDEQTLNDSSVGGRAAS